MPPLPSPGKVIRTALKFSWGSGETGGTRFYIGYSSSPPTAANLNTYVGEVASLVNSDLAPLISEGISLIEVTAADLESTSGAEATNTVSDPGTRAGAALPMNVCAVVDYIIGRHYRGGKPRGYWPFGIASDMASDQTWDGTLISAVNSAFGTWMAAILAYSGDSITKTNHLNVGYYQGVNTPTTLPSGRVKQSSKLLTTPNVDQVTTHQMRTIIGSQRRRLTT